MRPRGDASNWCEANDHVTLPAHPITVAAFSSMPPTPEPKRESGPTRLPLSAPGLRRSITSTAPPAICPRPHELVTGTSSGILCEYAAAGEPTPYPSGSASGRRHQVARLDRRERCQGWADEVLERRDSTILLIGFAGAYRRSELADPRHLSLAVRSCHLYRPVPTEWVSFRIQLSGDERDRNNEVRMTIRKNALCVFTSWRRL